jgi:hypothetical protein
MHIYIYIILLDVSTTYVNVPLCKIQRAMLYSDVYNFTVTALDGARVLAFLAF